MGIVEQSLIGAIISKNSVMADIASIVNQDDFTDKNAKQTYVFCLSQWSADKPIDLTIIAHALYRDVDMAWLAESTGCGFPASAVSYAIEIADIARVARIKKGVAGLLGSDFGATDLISSLSNICMEEEDGHQLVSSGLESVDSFSALRKAGGIKGLSTGYHFLDRKNIKLVRGNYWVVGAATSVGKTAFAMNVLSNLLDENAKVAVISTEMTKDQMISRLVAYMTDIPAYKIIENDLKHEADFEKVDLAERDLSGREFFMSDRVNEISDIENVVKGLNIKHNLDVIIVDYIQHCTSVGHKSVFDVTSDVSNRLQRLAKSADVCVIGLSQIANAASKETRATGKPVAEFKGSGDIAADCDVGIIMTRLLSDDVGRNRMATVVKNRHGRTARNALMFTPQYSRLEEVHDNDNY